MSFPKEKGDSSSNTMPKTEAEKKDETVSAQDQVRRAQLKMQFYGTKKGDHETIEAYVKQLKSISNSVEATGNPIPDPDMVLQLLAGLPSQYLPFRKTISSQFPLPVFSEACSILYMYETLLQEQSAKAQSANFSSSSSAENSNSSKSSTTNDTEIKKTVEMIREIASAVTSVASIARDFLSALPSWSGHSTSSKTTKPAAPANTGNKKNTKKPNPGRGNYHKRGPSTTNSHNSARK